MSQRQHSDTSEIKALLVASIESLARELVPNGSRSGHYWIGACPWRADNKPGSFWINLAGAKVPGSFKDAATGEKGDVFRLIQLAIGLPDFKATLQWSRDFLGLGQMPQQRRRELVAKVEADREQHAKRDAERLVESRRAAKAIWLNARPLVDSVAERYLAARGIDLSRLPHLPRALRCDSWHRHVDTNTHWPCMMAMMTGPDGSCFAVHRTWLARDGSAKAPLPKVPGRNGEMIEPPVRKIWPSFQGAAIRLWRGASNLTEREAREAGLRETLVIGEGIEDGLSVALACPELRVWAAGSLGNLLHVVPPECADEIVVCADNDWGKPQAARQLDAALERFAQMGLPVRVARSPVGKDFNDALMGVG